MIVESQSGDDVRGAWPLRIVLLSSFVALVAETAPPTYQYPFDKSVTGPETELTTAAPNARYRVRIQATGVAPNGRSTTDNATGFVNGQIAIVGVEDAPFVVASVSRDGITRDAELSALATFQLPIDLAFEGNCTKPSEASPCTATFFVDFARDDGGDRGGSVTVSYRLEFQSSVSKDSDPNGRKRELPWSVEIVAE